MNAHDPGLAWTVVASAALLGACSSGGGGPSGTEQSQLQTDSALDNLNAMSSPGLPRP